MSKAKSKVILRELEDVAVKKGIKIRYEKTKARGGMCEHKGKQMIIIDRAATDDYKISVVVDNLRRVKLDDLELSPRMKELIFEL